MTVIINKQDRSWNGKNDAKYKDQRTNALEPEDMTDRKVSSLSWTADGLVSFKKCNCEEKKGCIYRSRWLVALTNIWKMTLINYVC